MYFAVLKKTNKKGKMEMKKGKSPEIVQEKTCAKPECKKASTVCCKEENLKKLVKSCKPESFVRQNNGCWDHQAWLVFCGEIVEEGYDPIDFDQIGLILENHKTAFLSQI